MKETSYRSSLILLVFVMLLCCSDPIQKVFDEDDFKVENVTKYSSDSLLTREKAIYRSEFGDLKEYDILVDTLNGSVQVNGNWIMADQVRVMLKDSALLLASLFFFHSFSDQKQDIHNYASAQLAPSYSGMGRINGQSVLVRLEEDGTISPRLMTRFVESKTVNGREYSNVFYSDDFPNEPWSEAFFTLSSGLIAYRDNLNTLWELSKIE